MNYILFDGPYKDNLLPFTYTRPVADIRIGILTIREKWERYLKTTTTTVTEDYLSEKYPMVELDHNIMINASVLPNDSLVNEIKNLQLNQAIYFEDELIAFYSLLDDDAIDFEKFDRIELDEEPLVIRNTWDVFSKNGEAIALDFKNITTNRTSAPIPESVNVINSEHVTFSGIW